MMKMFLFFYIATSVTSVTSGTFTMASPVTQGTKGELLVRISLSLPTTFVLHNCALNL